MSRQIAKHEKELGDLSKKALQLEKQINDKEYFLFCYLFPRSIPFLHQSGLSLLHISCKYVLNLKSKFVYLT